MSKDGGIRELREQMVLDLMAKRERGKVLDIGCQSGGFCGALRSLGFEPYGIEVSEPLIRNATKNHPGIKFDVGDCGKEIPYEDKFFDYVWAGEVIEHIPTTDVFVNEINRVLKVGGTFFLSTPLHNRLKSVLIALFRFEEHFDPEFPHFRFYTLKSLDDVLGKRGFQFQSVKFVGRIPVIANTMIVEAKKMKDASLIIPALH